MVFDLSFKGFVLRLFALFLIVTPIYSLPSGPMTHVPEKLVILSSFPFLNGSSVQWLAVPGEPYRHLGSWPAQPAAKLYRFDSLAGAGAQNIHGTILKKLWNQDISDGYSFATLTGKNDRLMELIDVINPAHTPALQGMVKKWMRWKSVEGTPYTMWFGNFKSRGYKWIACAVQGISAGDRDFQILLWDGFQTLPRRYTKCQDILLVPMIE